MKSVIHTKCGEEFQNVPIFGGLTSVLYCNKCGESCNDRNSRIIDRNPVVENGKRKYFHYIDKS